MSADVALVTMSLSGDAEAQRQLARRVLDTVHRAVAEHMSGDAAEDILKRVQEVFVALLERDAEELRAWDPDDGLDLEHAIAALAERRVAAILGEREAEPKGEPPTPWTPLSDAEREGLLAKIVARLDQGETLAENDDEIRLRGQRPAGILRTTPDLPFPPPVVDQGSTAWRPTSLHIAATIAAVAVAVALAFGVG